MPGCFYELGEKNEKQGGRQLLCGLAHARFFRLGLRLELDSGCTSALAHFGLLAIGDHPADKAPAQPEEEAGGKFICELVGERVNNDLLEVTEDTHLGGKADQTTCKDGKQNERYNSSDASYGESAHGFLFLFHCYCPFQKLQIVTILINNTKFHQFSISIFIIYHIIFKNQEVNGDFIKEIFIFVIRL